MSNETNLRDQIQFYNVTDNTNTLKYANKLLQGQILCLNFNDCDIEQAKEALHFLCGVNYATDGLVKTLKANIYLFALKEHYRDQSIKKFIQEYSI